LLAEDSPVSLSHAGFPLSSGGADSELMLLLHSTRFRDRSIGSEFDFNGGVMAECRITFFFFSWPYDGQRIDDDASRDINERIYRMSAPSRLMRPIVCPAQKRETKSEHVVVHP
jgi:hypothetical protein